MQVLILYTVYSTNINDQKCIKTTDHFPFNLENENLREKCNILGLAKYSSSFP